MQSCTGFAAVHMPAVVHWPAHALRCSSLGVRCHAAIKDLSDSNVVRAPAIWSPGQCAMGAVAPFPPPVLGLITQCILTRCILTDMQVITTCILHLTSGVMQYVLHIPLQSLQYVLHIPLRLEPSCWRPGPGPLAQCQCTNSLHDGCAHAACI